MKTNATSFLYLTEIDIQKTMTVSEAVALAEKGIYADANGQVTGDKFYMPVSENGFIKPFSGYLLGEEFAFVKTFSYFPENPPSFGLSTTSSMVLLFSAQTGYPVCMMEGNWVTALKTGASTAVTAAHLARPDSQNLVIFGAGSLGRMHLRALAQCFDFQQAYLIDILPEVAEICARELAPELPFSITPVPLSERETVVRLADILVTVTTGNMPLIQRNWLKPGAFIARLGSYQELDLDVITGADKVVVDNWHYVSPRIPELIQLAEQGRFDQGEIYAEWPAIVAGDCPGRDSQDEIIIFIALGIWGEYAALLPEIYRRARSLGLGQWIISQI